MLEPNRFKHICAIHLHFYFVFFDMDCWNFIAFNNLERG